MITGRLKCVKMISKEDLIPVEFAIWSVIQQRVYETRVHDINELRQHQMHVLHGLEQSLTDDAVD